MTSVVGRKGFLSRRPRNFSLPQKIVKALGIRSESLKQKVGELSGGNQQKVVLSKWLVDNSDVLLLDEPTRGLDVGAKADLFHQVRELANAGSAVLVASSEMPEVLAYCDSLYVLFEGKKVGFFSPDEDSKKEILESMISGKVASHARN